MSNSSEDFNIKLGIEDGENNEISAEMINNNGNNQNEVQLNKVKFDSVTMKQKPNKNKTKL